MLGCGVGESLRRLGKRPDWDLDSYAILRIPLAGTTRDWHWVVWDFRRGRVLDPEDPPRHKFEPTSYLWVGPALTHPVRHAPRRPLTTPPCAP